MLDGLGQSFKSCLTTLRILPQKQTKTDPPPPVTPTATATPTAAALTAQQALVEVVPLGSTMDKSTALTNYLKPLTKKIEAAQPPAFKIGNFEYYTAKDEKGTVRLLQKDTNLGTGWDQWALITESGEKRLRWSKVKDDSSTKKVITNWFQQGESLNSLNKNIDMYNRAHNDAKIDFTVPKELNFINPPPKRGPAAPSPAALAATKKATAATTATAGGSLQAYFKENRLTIPKKQPNFKTKSQHYYMVNDRLLQRNSIGTIPAIIIEKNGHLYYRKNNPKDSTMIENQLHPMEESLVRSNIHQLALTLNLNPDEIPEPLPATQTATAAATLPPPAAVKATAAGIQEPLPAVQTVKERIQNKLNEPTFGGQSPINTFCSPDKDINRDDISRMIERDFNEDAQKLFGKLVCSFKSELTKNFTATTKGALTDTFILHSLVNPTEYQFIGSDLSWVDDGIGLVYLSIIATKFDEEVNKTSTAYQTFIAKTKKSGFLFSSLPLEPIQHLITQATEGIHEDLL